MTAASTLRAIDDVVNLIPRFRIYSGPAVIWYVAILLASGVPTGGSPPSLVCKTGIG